MLLPLPLRHGILHTHSPPYGPPSYHIYTSVPRDHICRVLKIRPRRSLQKTVALSGDPLELEAHQDQGVHSALGSCTSYATRL